MLRGNHQGCRRSQEVRSEPEDRRRHADKKVSDKKGKFREKKTKDTRNTTRFKRKWGEGRWKGLVGGNRPTSGTS